MHSAHGLRKYFYEFLFHASADQAREATGEIVPVSQARAIRRRVDELLAQRGTALADPRLGVTACLTAIDAAFGEAVHDYEPQFGDHSPSNARYQQLQSQFMQSTGVGAPAKVAEARLPISPYDPQWSSRAALRSGGTALAYLPDEAIMEATGGPVESLAQAEHGDLILFRLDEKGQLSEAGQALSDEDAAGLTLLMDSMSQAEYEQVRDWVIDGGRDMSTGTVDRRRFTTTAGLARSAAMLADLREQGISYQISPDRRSGQIKARVEGGMEIRLTDPGHSEYAGARIYDNGTVIRYSSTARVPGGVAVPSVTPAQAVDLLHVAQGKRVMRADHPDLAVGELGGTHPDVAHGRPEEVSDAYQLNQEAMFVAGDYTLPGERAPRGKLMIRRDASEKSLPMIFVDAAAAQTYLREAVDSARVNLEAALDVDGLITEYNEQVVRHSEVGLDDDETAPDFEPPEFSGNDEIAAIQRSYWDVLTGVKQDLLRPGATTSMFQQRLDQIGELPAGGELSLGNLTYLGSAEEKVRSHASDVSIELIGDFEPTEHDIDDEFVQKRFDPNRVATYMNSPTGRWSNLDNLAVACRRAEIEPDEMLGSDTDYETIQFKNKLVRFDPGTAVPLAGHESPFLAGIGQVVHDTLARNATVAGQMLIDDQGVISWTGDKVRRNGLREPVSGQIGQVFDPGEYGEVVTKFTSDANYLTVPGYEGRIRAQTPGERASSVEERTILRGYEQFIHASIGKQLAEDLTSTRTQVGQPSSLNAVYGAVSGTRHPVDFIERARFKGTDFSDSSERLLSTVFGNQAIDPQVQSILATEARRVRYSNVIKAGSTIYAEYRADRDGVDLADDNRFDAWRLTGGRNMVVLTGRDASGVAAPGGYFDEVMTAGGTNQGVVRYLTRDAVVRTDGTIEPGDPNTVTGSRTPLRTLPELDSMAYDAWDRQQMTLSTIMQSSEVTDPVGTSLMTFGGWSADDGIVVSSNFAQAHQIRGAGGQLRDLVAGDKLSDLHGNKGVISLIVDPHMDSTEAQAQGVEQEVAWFQSNPEMDVVMSPFSLISRRNAGAGRELMGDRPEALLDLKRPDASKAAVSGVGQMRFVVTHMAVDEKTKIYDEEQVLAGRGRKASSQLAWALQSKDCPAIMAEFYGHNSGAESNLREYLAVSGMGMDAAGRLRMGSAPTDNEPERRLFSMPDLVLTKPRKNGQPALNTSSMRRSFSALIGNRGGDLELPFALTFPTEEQIPATSSGSWKLPVLSSHLRSTESIETGMAITHEYTRRYQDIFVEACRYRFMADRLAQDGISDVRKAELTTGMREAQTRAQRSFGGITTGVRQQVFEGRKNIFKQGLMSSRLSDSATMVWSADPRLDIDQIALSTAKAAQLGLNEGDHALVWRDPILRDAGVRYLRVAIDDRLTGAAINPVMDKCFDGDFDGDAVGIARLHSQAAHDEALVKFSVASNLLDTGVAPKEGQYPLAMQLSLDTAVAYSKDAELADEFASATAEANQILTDEQRLDQGFADEVRRLGDAYPVRYDRSLSTDEAAIAMEREREHTRWELSAWRDKEKADLDDRRAELVGELSDLYRSAQSSEFGSALRFDSAYEHVASMYDVCVATGAKGSMSKLAKYADNLGLQVDDHGNWYNVDHGEPGITRADQEASMFATAIKAHGTGLGGSFSQRAVRALRGEDLKSVLEVTYPVTQSILQAKHSASQARHKYEMLQGPGRDLWRGRLLEHTGPGTWRSSFVDGSPVQADMNTWIEQFTAFYTSDDGFGVEVNPEHVAKVAGALVDPDTGRMRNLDDDPALAGSTMDQLAYGGDFSQLVQAATAGRDIFEGHFNEQFASAATRTRREAVLDAAGSAPGVDTELVSVTGAYKSDVLADQLDGARVRKSGQRSPNAVAVNRPLPVYEPDTEPVMAGDDYQMGV